MVDGDKVPENSITSGQYWKPTSVATRFYCSENRGMRKFKKVICFICKSMFNILIVLGALRVLSWSIEGGFWKSG